MRERRPRDRDGDVEGDEAEEETTTTAAPKTMKRDNLEQPSAQILEKIDIDDRLTGLTGSGVGGIERVDRRRSNEDDDVVEHELGICQSIDRENVAIHAVSIELGIRVVQNELDERE